MIVVVCGVPGVGKSAVAADLAARLSAVHLSVDPVEDALLASGLPPGWQTGVAAYEATRACAELNLGLGRRVVVDAVNDSEAARTTWRTASDRTSSPLVFVQLTCGDEAEHRRRLEGRARGFSQVAEPTWEQVVERTATYEPWADGECLLVDAGPAVHLVVDEVQRRILERHPSAVTAVDRRGPGDPAVPQDGAAVEAARAALVSRWRSTVVPGDRGWVVRTWTSTPPGARRPVGAPDVVHTVEEQQGGFVVRQVHPADEVPPAG